MQARFSRPARRGGARRSAFFKGGIGNRSRRAIARIRRPIRLVPCMLKRIVLVGLGNPGERYRFTRHNAGFMLLDGCALHGGLRWEQPAREYHEARGELYGAEAVLLKPMTYVNLSGHALRSFGAREEFSADELLVVCDDFNLPLGMMRVRRRGGHGGHNGLASIIEQLGVDAFARLRIGIGPLPQGADPADFVLAPFDEAELDRVSSAVERAAKCIETVVMHGIDEAMGRFNMREPLGETG